MPLLWALTLFLTPLLRLMSLAKRLLELLKGVIRTLGNLPLKNVVPLPGAENGIHVTLNVDTNQHENIEKRDDIEDVTNKNS